MESPQEIYCVSEQKRYLEMIGTFTLFLRIVSWRREILSDELGQVARCLGSY